MFRRSGMYVLTSLFVVFFFVSCQERMVCPAYQSTYILDDSVRSVFFSRFESDSTPKRYARVHKTDYGIIKKKKNKEKHRQMRTVAMKNILPPKQKPDSTLTRVRSLEELNRVKDELNEPSSSQ